MSVRSEAVEPTSSESDSQGLNLGDNVPEKIRQQVASVSSLIAKATQRVGTGSRRIPDSSAIPSEEEYREVCEAINSLAEVVECVQDYITEVRGGDALGSNEVVDTLFRHAAGNVINSLELIDKVSLFVKPEHRFPIQCRIAACRLILAIYPQQSDPIESYVKIPVLLFWAYADMFLKNDLPNDHYSMVSATGVRIVHEGNTRNPVSSTGSTRVPTLDAYETNGVKWFSTGAEERQLRSELKRWWQTDKQNAKTLRALATGLLAFAVSENRQIAAVVLEKHPKHEINSSFPKVLIRRLKHELFPQWLNNLKDNVEYKCALRFVAAIGIYQEIVADLLRESVLDFLRRLLDLEATRQDMTMQLETLEALCRILVHKKVALRFVETGGAEKLLSLTSSGKNRAHLSGEIILCLVSLGQRDVVIEKLTQRAEGTMRRLMEFAVSLLVSPWGIVRLNSLEFLSCCINCPSNLSVFDDLHGPSKVMDNIASPISSQHIVKPQQVIKFAMYTLKQYFFVHVALVTHTVRMRLSKATRPTGLKGSNTNARSRSVSISSICSTGSSYTRPLPEDKYIRVDEKSHAANLSFLSQARQIVIPGLTTTKWQPLDEMFKYEYAATNTETRGSDQYDSNGETESPLTENEQRIDDKNSNGIGLLLSVVAFSTENGTPFGLETATMALEILRVITFLPFAYDEVCCKEAPTASFSRKVESLMNNVTIPKSPMAGIGTLLEAALSSQHPDAGVTVAALEVLCNCCSPSRGVDKAQRNVRRLARHQNAIMTLLALLRYDNTPRAADKVRYLSCLVLLGLARDKQVAQVLDSLQIASTLSRIARSDPVLVENTRIHKKLRKACLELIQLATGKTRLASQLESDETWLAGIISEAADATKSKIEKGSIVSRTEITFDSKELLHLIREHLEKRGLARVARLLEKEAHLPRDFPKSRSYMLPIQYRKKKRIGENNALACSREEMGKSYNVSLPPWPSYSIINVQNGKTIRARNPKPLSQLPVKVQIRTSLPAKTVSGYTKINFFSEPNSTDSQKVIAHLDHSKLRRLRSPRVTLASIKPGSGKSRSGRKKKRKRSNRDNHSSTYMDTAMTTAERIHENRIPEYEQWQGEFWKQRGRILHSSCNAGTSLENIVQEHLREQHRNCPRPVGLVPSFSLLDDRRHRCTGKSLRSSPLNNIANRLYCRELSNAYENYVGRSVNRRYVHGRARWMRTYKMSDSTGGLGNSFTTVSFFSHHSSAARQASYSRHVLCGTMMGDVVCFDTAQSTRVAEWDLGSTATSDLKTTQDGRLIFTCNEGSNSAQLWQVKDEDCTAKPRNLCEFECNEIELGLAGLKLLGTQFRNGSNNVAVLYDVPTGKRLNSFVGQNQYLSQKSSFGPDGITVCVDGMLWDVRTRNPIHKFDKISKFGYSVFHPTGNQLVIDSAVWDLRTFRLYLTCKTFQESAIMFDPVGDVAYSFRPDSTGIEGFGSNINSTILVTDALQYTTLSAISVDKQIHDLSIDQYGEHFAVVTYKAHPENEDSSTCRLYEIGRTKPDDDDSDYDVRSDSEEESSQSSSDEGIGDDASLDDILHPFLLRGVDYFDESASDSETDDSDS